MTELAREVARNGSEVHFVAEEALSQERRAMGWVPGDLDPLEVHLVKNPAQVHNLIDRLPSSAVHITSGVRANGLIADAQKRIIDLCLRHYLIMEKVDLRGTARWIKPVVYTARLRAVAGKAEGMLCIGEGTDSWIARRAPKSLKVFPFAYFLRGTSEARVQSATGPFRLIYVGSHIERKRVDLLLEALTGLKDRSFALETVGDGPARAQLEHMARRHLPSRVAFLGTLEMAEAIERIKKADCLVLPSDHDGFGAVVSEALINGTPAICSSECGAAGVVRASELGAVFAAGDVEDMRRVLREMLDRGPLSVPQQEELSDWARCLNAASGARYLLQILDHDPGADMISPPWERGCR